ncbi:MAG: TonB-dependent receptor [Bacteroidota bacterium]|nr:TonB-dependent receptor [Bacteroidota bacterium]
MKHLSFPLVLLLIFSSACLAQNPDHIYLDTLYINTMDKVLDNISKKHHVKFAFDRELLSQYDMNERPMMKPLSLFLSQECSSRKLKWNQGADSIIYIMEKYENLTSKPVGVEEKKTYFGPVKKKDFILTGVVRDKETGEALPYANIGIKGTSLGTFTNPDGYFTLLKVPSDTSTIVVSYLGYKAGTVFLTPSMPVSNLLIEMDPESQILKEVVIEGDQQRLLTSNDKISLLKITPAKLSTLPNIGEKDVIRSFQLLPGVSCANESSSNLYVRGGTPDQNLILYDGFTVYQVDHLYGFFSAFNSNAIKDVQLYKGGFESKYGGRLSSVTEITGKDGNSKGFAIGGEISLLSVNAYAEIPIGKRFTSLIAFRRSYQGLLYDRIFKQFNMSSQVRQVSFGGNGPKGESSSSDLDVVSYFYDINAKLTYKPSKKDILSLSFYDGTDDLDNSMNVSGGGGFNFNMDNSDKTKYGNIGSGFRWTRNWTSRLTGTSMISYSNYFSDRTHSNSGIHFRDEGSESSFSSGVTEKNNLVDLSFKNDYSYGLNSLNQPGFGVFMTKYIISYDYGENDSSFMLDKNQNGIMGGMYLQDKIKLMDSRFFVTPGIRSSWFSPTHKFYSEPRLSLTYNLNKNFKFTGETGKYYQFANRVIREDFYSGSKDFWILSNNTNIPVSSAWHYIAGISYENKNFLASIEGYYKSIDGVTEYSMRFKPANGGSNYAENFFNGKGYATGLECLLQKKYGDFTGWIGYTLGKAMNKISMYGDSYFPAAQDVTHEFKCVGMYDFKRWSFSVTWLYGSGRPYTAPDGEYTVHLLDGTDQVYIKFGDKNSSRLPAYHRLDLSVNYHLKNSETNNEWGMIGFSIFNVYNRRNIWYKEYQIIDGNILETDKLFLGFTPNLTLSINLK